MTTTAGPICMHCRHLRPREEGDEGDRTCDAFPEGIPAGIWFEGGDHREPVRGDHGIQFEGTLPAHHPLASRRLRA